jgi:hypothetical protein
MYLIRTNELVEYFPFDTFVKTCIEKCNGIQMRKYDLVNMMWWMYAYDIPFYENVVLWNHMSIALHQEMNSITINLKYHYENMYCHFYRMLIYITLCGLCLANEWNAFINSQNDIVKSIKNLTTYQKQNSTDFFLWKSQVVTVYIHMDYFLTFWYRITILYFMPHISFFIAYIHLYYFKTLSCEILKP